MTGWDWLGLIGVLMVGGSIVVALLAVVSAIVRDVRDITEARSRLRRPTPVTDPVDLDDVHTVLHLVRGGCGDYHGDAA